MPRTVEDIIAELYDAMDFDMLISWADLLNVEHDKEHWLDDECTDKESALRQEVAEAAIKVFEEHSTHPLVMINMSEVEVHCANYRKFVLGDWESVKQEVEDL